MSSGFVDRMVRAAKLDASLYEEVESDRSATAQAMGVVALSSLAAGVGTMGRGAEYGPIPFLLGTVSAVVEWVVWAVLIYFIGTRLLPQPGTRADVGELLRTTGFSTAPGIIRLAGIVPGLWIITFMAAMVWNIITMVVAVRQALDYRSTSRAIAVCVLGWLVVFIVGLFLRGTPLQGI